MGEKKGPKAFKRHIFDDKGKKLLIEAFEHMKRAVGKIDTVCEDHLVEDWVIVYREEMSGESLRSLYRWLEEKHPEIMKEWRDITRG